MPLEMEQPPYVFNSASPTPLDPDSLSIARQPYMTVALDHMMARLYRNTEGSDIRATDLKAVEGEIETQHFERSTRNAKTMDRLREYAANDKNNRKLSIEEAEGIMQLRAGVARVTPALSLLARVPELEAIELTKATRPLCLAQYTMARQALDSTARSLEANKKMSASVMDGVEATPYRYIIDEEHGTIITKRRLASIAIDGVNLEIICRDSYRGSGRGSFGDSIEHVRAELGPAEVDLTPVSIISYARVAQSK